ncbi:MAG TPA: hypothetical protein VMW90_04955 [Acidobacteriota bacterium]|nr:hypothetical protein [Acidobacteriota bacterium]
MVVLINPVVDTVERSKYGNVGRKSPRRGGECVQKDSGVLGQFVDMGTCIPCVSIAAKMIRPESVERDEDHVLCDILRCVDNRIEPAGQSSIASLLSLERLSLDEQEGKVCYRYGKEAGEAPADYFS